MCLHNEINAALQSNAARPLVRATSYDKAATTTTRRDDGRAEGRKDESTEEPKVGRTEGRKDGRTEEPKNRRTRRPLCKREEAAPMQPSLLTNLSPRTDEARRLKQATSSLAGVKPRRLDLWQEQQLAMKRRGYDNNEMGQHAAQCARSTNMEDVPIAAASPPPLLAP